VQPFLQRKAICIIYSEGVFVPLVIEHAMSMRRIDVCCPSVCTIFLHIISYLARFLGKQNYWT